MNCQNVVQQVFNHSSKNHFGITLHYVSDFAVLVRTRILAMSFLTNLDLGLWTFYQIQKISRAHIS